MIWILRANTPENFRVHLSKRRSFNSSVEAALVVPADVGVDTAHREVHLAQSVTDAVQKLWRG